MFKQIAALFFAGVVLLLTPVNYVLAASDFAIGKKALDNKDYLAAVKAFRAGVAKGDKLSANALGEMYILGLGLGRDPVIACKLFFKGAQRGDLVAQHNYGVCVAKGDNLNAVEAVKWFNKAIKGGHKPSFCSLGNLR